MSGTDWGLTKTGVLQGALREEILDDLQYRELADLDGSWPSDCYDPPLLRVTAQSYVVDCYCFCERGAPEAARALGAAFDGAIERLADEGRYWEGPIRLLVWREPSRDGEPETLASWPLDVALADLARDLSEFWVDGELQEQLLEGYLIDDPDDAARLRTMLQETVVRRRGGSLSVHDTNGLAYGLLGRDEVNWPSTRNRK